MCNILITRDVQIQGCRTEEFLLPTLLPQVAVPDHFWYGVFEKADKDLVTVQIKIATVRNYQIVMTPKLGYFKCSSNVIN